MNIEKRAKIETFVRLGEVLHSEMASGRIEKYVVAVNGAESKNENRPHNIQELISEATRANSWYTEEYIRVATAAICDQMLNRERLTEWLESYPALNYAKPKRVGVIMAGNIPMVGFSDMLTVLICGHSCLAKPSSKDRVLIEHIIRTLKSIDPSIPITTIQDSEWKNADLDAVIATGSDNTSRYFKAHFASTPMLLRGSRHSIAVLNGTESASDLTGLRSDIFHHFGMGCRNVSHIFAPNNYDFTELLNALKATQISNPKFLNNYLESRALLTMSGIKFFDGGFFILHKSDQHSDYISTITYSHYSNISEVEQWCKASDSSLQAVVGHAIEHPRGVYFGQAQQPSLTEYPDGVDVVDFLQKI